MSCISHVLKNWKKLEDLNWMEVYDVFQTSVNNDFNNYDS